MTDNVTGGRLVSKSVYINGAFVHDFLITKIHWGPRGGGGTANLEGDVSLGEATGHATFFLSK